MVEAEASRSRQAAADVFGVYFFGKITTSLFSISNKPRTTLLKIRQIKHPHNFFYIIGHVKTPIYIFFRDGDGIIAHQTGSSRCSRSWRDAFSVHLCVVERGSLSRSLGANFCMDPILFRLLLSHSFVIFCACGAV